MSWPFVCDVRCPPVDLALVTTTTRAFASATIRPATTHHTTPLRALDRACATALLPSRPDFAAALEPFLVAISTLHPRALATQLRWPHTRRSTIYVHR